MMFLRFLCLFIPLRRVIWVRKFDGTLILARLSRKEFIFSKYYQATYWKGCRRYISTLEMHRKMPEDLDTKVTWVSELFSDWGEYYPWWKKKPIVPEDRTIEINIRAKPRREYGQLRKTRTLSQVWEQG